MKVEQAPIEIAKELHELNKKLSKIIDILSKGNLVIPVLQEPKLYEPALYAQTLDGSEDVLMTGNPEAHDYGVGYLGKGTGDAEQEQHLQG